MKKCLNASLVIKASVVVPTSHRFLRPMDSAHWVAMQKCNFAESYVNMLLPKQLGPSVMERDSSFYKKCGIYLL
jgi:hypothetical protein